MAHSTGLARAAFDPLPALLGLWLWREPGLEDRPSNFGSPQRVVSGIGGADEVILANRPGGRKLMLGHVSGEGTVSPVDFGAGTEVDDRCQLCWRDHGGADAPDRLWQRIARKEDREPSPVLGEQVGVEDAPEGSGR